MKRIVSLAFIITFIVALIDACSSYPFNSHHYHRDTCFYQIYLDDRFNPVEKATALSAIAEWNQRVPELYYSLTVEPLQEKYPIEERVIHIHCGYASDMDKKGTVGYTFWDDRRSDYTGAEVYLNMTPDLVQNDEDIIYTRKVFEHELGHAFALSHVEFEERAYDIMNPVCDIKNHITQEDIDKFYQLHPSCINNISDGGE